MESKEPVRNLKKRYNLSGYTKLMVGW